MKFREDLRAPAGARPRDERRAVRLPHRARSPGARDSSRRPASSSGQIAPAPRGTNGFGYDPIFYYPPFGCTLAEVDLERKATVSHRGKAFGELREFLTRGSGSGLGARNSRLVLAAGDSRRLSLVNGFANPESRTPTPSPEPRAPGIPTLRPPRPSNALEERFMKTLVLAASLLTAAALPPAALERQPTLDGTWRARLQDNWTRKDGQQWLSLQMDRDDDHFGISFPMDELQGLGARGDRGRRATSVSGCGATRARSTSRATSRMAEEPAPGGSCRTRSLSRPCGRRYQDLSTEQAFRLAIHDVSRASSPR